MVFSQQKRKDPCYAQAEKSKRIPDLLAKIPCLSRQALNFFPLPCTVSPLYQAINVPTYSLLLRYIYLCITVFFALV